MKPKKRKNEHTKPKKRRYEAEKTKKRTYEAEKTKIRSRKNEISAVGFHKTVLHSTTQKHTQYIVYKQKEYKLIFKLKIRDFEATRHTLIAVSWNPGFVTNSKLKNFKLSRKNVK